MFNYKRKGKNRFFKELLVAFAVITMLAIYIVPSEYSFADDVSPGDGTVCDSGDFFSEVAEEADAELPVEADLGQGAPDGQGEHDGQGETDGQGAPDNPCDLPDESASDDTPAIFEDSFVAPENLQTDDGAFSVTYFVNEGSGSVPVDDNVYAGGDTATVLGADGLSKVITVPNVEYGGTVDLRFDFMGWNTDAYGLGEMYQPGGSITIGGDVSLFAIWQERTTSVPRPFFAPLSQLMAVGYKPDNDTPGSLSLSKTAKPNPNSSLKDNLWEWDITLTLHGVNLKTTSDIVLLIDTSTSMNSGGKLAGVKAAANEFVRSLLPAGNDGSTRIALVSFNSEATTDQKFTSSAGDLTGKINGLLATGSTFMQAGIMQAQGLLADSAAKNKYILLLSDGEPTYSYQIRSVSGGLTANYTVANQTWQSWNINYENLGLNFGALARTGNGFTFTGGITTFDYTYYNEGGIIRTYAFPPDNGVATIWQAVQAKKVGYVIYSIAANGISADGIDVLKKCANCTCHYYDATDSANLQVAFNEIAGKIAYAANNATVTDPMGEFFTMMNAGGGAGEVKDIVVSQGTALWDGETQTIKWNVGDVREEDGYITMTYTVKIASNPESGADQYTLYPTNKDTTVDYTDAWGEEQEDQFVVPKVGFPEVGTITTHTYLLNEDGKPVDVNGLPASERIHIDLYGRTPLVYTGEPIKFDGYVDELLWPVQEDPYEIKAEPTIEVPYGDDGRSLTYVFVTGDKANLGDKSPAEVSVTPLDTSKVVYFAYQIKRTFAVEYAPGDHGTWAATDESYGVAKYDPAPAFGAESGADVDVDRDAGYTFAGWFDGTTLYAPDDALPEVTKDVTYTAQWTANTDVDVTYYRNWDAEDPEPFVDENNTFGEPYQILDYDDDEGSVGTAGFKTPEDYTFIHWATKADGAGDVYGAGDNIEELDYDFELYARYAFDYADTEITITVLSNEKVYDGNPLSPEGFTVEGLPEGYTLDVTGFSGSITYVAESDIELGGIDAYAITRDSDGMDMTDVFKEALVEKGALDVTPRPVTITAGSASMTYNGSPLTDKTYTLSAGTLAAGDSVTKLAVTGSQTEVGSSDNIPSGAVIQNAAGADVTEDYDITYAQGILTVTAPTPIPTIYYTVTYAPGTQGTFGAQAYGSLVYGSATPGFAGTATGNAGYVFNGWAPAVAATVTGNVTYTAQWIPAAVTTPTPPGATPPATTPPGQTPQAPTPPAQTPQAPTPPAQTPPAETPPATISPTPTPQAASATDPVSEPLATIPPTPTPLLSIASWALLNLLLTIVTGIIMLLLLVTYFQKKKDEEHGNDSDYGYDAGSGPGSVYDSVYDYDSDSDDERKVRKHLGFRLVTIATTAFAIILFILTEDMRLPMAIADTWTFWHVVIAAATAVMALFSRKKYEAEDEKDKEKERDREKGEEVFAW